MTHEKSTREGFKYNGPSSDRRSRRCRAVAGKLCIYTFVVKTKNVVVAYNARSDLCSNCVPCTRRMFNKSPLLSCANLWAISQNTDENRKSTGVMVSARRRRRRVSVRFIGVQTRGSPNYFSLNSKWIYVHITVTQKSEFYKFYLDCV